MKDHADLKAWVQWAKKQPEMSEEQPLFIKAIEDAISQAGMVQDLRAQLAATQKAKAENDERFMIERDEARSEALRYREALGAIMAEVGTSTLAHKLAREALSRQGCYCAPGKRCAPCFLKEIDNAEQAGWDEGMRESSDERQSALPLKKCPACRDWRQRTKQTFCSACLTRLEVVESSKSNQGSGDAP